MALWIRFVQSCSRSAGEPVVVATSRVPKTPSNVAYGEIGLGPYNCATTVYLDDMIFEEIVPGVGAPLPVYVEGVQQRKGTL